MRAEAVIPGARYWLRSTSEPFEAYRVEDDEVDGFMKSGRRCDVSVSDIVRPLLRIRCVNGCGIFDGDNLFCPSCRRPVDPELRNSCIWPGSRGE
jgi:hypothetical protein